MATSGISTVSSYYTPALSFSGLSSDIDYQSIIDKLVEVESYSVNRMETWKEEWQEKIDALNTLNTMLEDFRTSVAAMDKLTTFRTKTATSSNETVLTASAATGAASGTHSVLVNQLAQAETSVHGGLTTADTVVNSSGVTKQFKFTYNGQAVSISVPDGATLSNLVDAINSSGANPGVTASILNVGGSDPTPYRLVLQGNQTGADYSITIDNDVGDADTLNGLSGTVDFTTGTFTESQTAQNAQIRVDGYPSGSWLERTSNTVSDVISGVTLTLQSSSTTAVQVSVTDDTEAQITKIEDMVANYNEVIAYIKDQTKYDGDTGETGILFGNYAVQIIKSKLNAIATGNAAGFANGIGVNKPDTYINLSQIGITTDYDETSSTFGQLLIDTEALESALTSNPEAVANLMSGYYKGVSEDTDGNVTYYSSLPGITQPGRYRIQVVTDGTKVVSATIDGHPATISASGDMITGANGYPEAGLAIKINTAAGTYDEYVRVQEGLNGLFSSELDDLLSASAGPVNILIKNYNDIIDSIDDKIGTEERRLESLRDRLTKQFSLLESLLAELNEQSDYLSKLSSTSSSS